MLYDFRKTTIHIICHILDAQTRQRLEVSLANNNRLWKELGNGYRGSIAVD